MKTGKKKVDNLDRLNHHVRTEILAIEASLLKIRKAIIAYEESRQQRGEDEKTTISD